MRRRSTKYQHHNTRDMKRPIRSAGSFEIAIWMVREDEIRKLNNAAAASVPNDTRERESDFCCWNAMGLNVYRWNVWPVYLALSFSFTPPELGLQKPKYKLNHIIMKQHIL